MVMRIKVLLLLMTMIVSNSLCLAQTKQCQPAKHSRLPAISELTYSKARKKLLPAGWQPLQTKSSADADEDADIKSGNGPLFWKRGYVELEACSGTGVAACAFLFKDAYGNHLRVTTAGEELPKQKAYATVTGFEFVCDFKQRNKSL